MFLPAAIARRMPAWKASPSEGAVGFTAGCASSTQIEDLLKATVPDLAEVHIHVEPPEDAG